MTEDEKKLYNKLNKEAADQRDYFEKDARKTQIKLSFFQEFEELQSLQKKANTLLSKRQMSVSGQNVEFFNRIEIASWATEVVDIMGKINHDSEYLSDFNKIQSSFTGDEVTYNKFEELRRIVREFINNPE